MKISKRHLISIIEGYLRETPEGSEAEQQTKEDPPEDEKKKEEISPLEFEINGKQYKATKTDDGGYDVTIMSGKEEIEKFSSKELGNDIKDYLGQWVSGAIDFKKKNPDADLSSELIQTWVDHIGKDLINRSKLVAFRGIEQRLSKYPT